MASGDVYQWTGAQSNSFTLAGNWYNTTLGAPATAVPGLTDEAIVVAGGVFAGPGFVSTLSLTGAGSGLTVQNVLYGGEVDVAGTVTLGSGAALASPGLIDIGDAGSALLMVGAGAFLNASPTINYGVDMMVGSNGGTGTLVVSGVGAVASSGVAGVSAGDAGTGAIVVSNGGTFEGGLANGLGDMSSGLQLGSDGGTGTMLVSGPGSAVEATYAVSVGNGGTGTLSVTDGAQFAAGNGTYAMLISLSGGSDHDGHGTVDFDASTGILNGLLAVGYNAPGSSVDAPGFMNLDHGARVSVDGGVLIGAQIRGSGTLSVASQSTLTAAYAIEVGLFGPGELDVANATVVSDDAPGGASRALDIGIRGGGVGLVTISGGLVDDALLAGTNIGDSGLGTLAVRASGGQAGTLLTGNTSGAAGLSVGLMAGGVGLIAVSGAASLVGVYGEVDDGVGGTGAITLGTVGELIAGDDGTRVGLALGESGSGTLAIDTGSVADVLGQTLIGVFGTGTLSVAGGSRFIGQASGAAALVVGASSLGTASVSVSGAGSEMALSGGLVVGNSGGGTLTVSSGASLVVSGSTDPGLPGVSIGQNAGSQGTFSVLGQAQVISGTGLVVGALGNGNLDITDADVNIAAAPGGPPALDVGGQSGGSGTVTVSGGELADTRAAGMIVGDGGTGVLTVSDGGVVLAGDPSRAAGLMIGNRAGGQGIVSVSGTASGMAVNGEIVLAGAGPTTESAASAGTLTLANGAKLSAGYATSGVALAVAQGGIESTGQVSLEGGANASLYGQTVIGAGGSGSLSVTGASSFIVTASGVPAMVISGANFASEVLVSDAGTRMSLAGGLDIGDAGSLAGMTIQNGAVVTSTSETGALGEALPGVAISGFGTLSLTGAGSSLQASGSFDLQCSNIGNSVLNISDGATMSVMGADGDATIESDLYAFAGVDGAGSKWTIAGQLILGEQSNGIVQLSIAAGGVVTAGSVLDGVSLPFGVEQSTITVMGAGSLLRTGGLTLGDDNSTTTTGLLKVQSGGAVSAAGSVSVTGTVALSQGMLTSGGTITVGSHSVISGTGTVQAVSVFNDGTISVSTGTLAFIGPIAAGVGQLDISGGGDLFLGSTVGSTQLVTFGAGGGTVSVLSAGSLENGVVGWSAGDVIDLRNVAATSDSFANGTLSLFGANSQLVGAIGFSGALASHNFSLTALGGGGTAINYHS